mgnify:CR=1 FL=1
MLQRQDSMTEAPRASKAEFEAFFGFVESHFELVKETMNSVSYRPGLLSIRESGSGVCVETMKATIENSVASENKLSPRLRESILRFFSEPAVMNSGGHKISMKNDNDRLDEYMNLLPNENKMTIVVAINKLSFASTYWQLPQTETEVAEDDDEFRFKVSLEKVAVATSSEKESTNPKSRPPFDWEFILEGTVDVRFVDTTKFTQLEVKFDKNFKQKTSFSPSAITALAKPRQAIYDSTDKHQEGGYQPIVIPKDAEVRDILAKVVHSNILFRAYSPDEQRAIVDAFQSVTADRDEVVIQQGEAGAYFYVIAGGELEILLEADGLEVPIGSMLGKGDYFGELALMYNTPRAASVKAMSQCDLWRIDRVTYRRIVTHYHNEALTENTSFLSNVVLHGKRVGDILDENEKIKVVSQLDMEEYSDGSIIVRQGNTGDSFYIIKSGTVAVWQQQDVEGVPTWVQVRTLNKGDFFGEKALLQEDVRSASCIAIGDVRCLSMHRDDFIGMLGEWKDVIAEADNKELMTEQGITVDPEKEKKQTFLKSMAIEDLTTLSVLGQGAFGRVKLAQHKTTGETFALKCQSKKAIVRNRIEDTVINEMRLMRMLDHERIGKLFCALQDTRNIYFVLELLQGGEFFTYLQKVGRLSEAKAVFYAASVVSAFTALHEKKIAYRDLKPENMVLDSKGFVKIVDLGLAKQIPTGKTWTMCGTPDYLAPEIILNEGHDHAVDYWALGVLIYEMVTGWPPFYADEPMKTYEKIVACSISFPVYITRQMSDVVSKLLATQPGRRLGNLKGGINDIMKHKWFGSFDWAGLDNLSIAVPYVPTIKGATDTSNFESYEDEKLADECNWTADLS